jgi:opacity protein-like surface antigen
MLISHSSIICITSLAVGVTSFASVADARFGRQHAPALPSWYLAANSSMSFIADTDLSDNVSGNVSLGELSGDDGLGFAGAIGYRPRNTGSFMDQLRFELEAGVMSNDVDNITSTSGALPTISGDVQSDRLMANLYLDYNATSQFRPYVGVGVGVARIHLDQNEDTVFAYQGMIGMYYTPASFPLLEFGLGYRYLGASDAELTSTTSGGKLEFDYEVHSLEAGIRAYF